MAEETQKSSEDDKKEEPKSEKASDEKKEAGKKPEESPDPPREIVLRVFMHCEGCAGKVRRCLKNFPGVEEVQTDCKTHKVVVKGEKADPLKVLERVQKKSHRKVELLSPIPKPPADDDPKKPEEKETPKIEEKKAEEPQVITVVLKVHMHCEACAQEIRKRILRMEGVESADPDLKSSQVTVMGAFEVPQLVEYVYKRTGKQAAIVKQDTPAPEKKGGEEDGKGKDGKEDTKVGEVEKKNAEDKADGSEGKDKEGGAEETAAKPAADEGQEDGEEETVAVELRKNEFYHYYPYLNYQIYPPPRFAAGSSSSPSYAYPPAPQMFSDENPNACSLV